MALAAPEGRRRSLIVMLILAVPLGACATWYGFLDDPSGSHPALKLGGAMAIAGVGVALLVLGRPMSTPYPQRGGTDHSALVAVDPLTLAVAWCSMGAALIHFAVVEQHFDELSLYGWFFVVVGVGELVWAVLAVATRSRLVLLAGAVGNAVVVATWIVSRSYGSLVGPDATQPAEVGFGDLVATVLEIVIVAGCVVLVWSGRYRRPALPSYWKEVLSFVVALGITQLTTLALYSAVGGPPFVSHVG